MAVSIADVAKRAGVSGGTVSHVLNNNGGARIAPATQERVRAAAAHLGYHPNRLARSLGRQRTDTIGLMISGLQNPFFVGLMEAAERRTQELGYQVMLDSAPSWHGTFNEHAKLRGWPVDGVLMWTTGRRTVEQYLGPQAKDLPVVYLGNAGEYSRDAVTFDIYGGARAAAEHLVQRGYRRIAFLLPYPIARRQGEQADGHSEQEYLEQEYLEDDLRWQASADVCRAAGVPLQFVVMERREETREAGHRAGLSLAALPPQERPDAVLCFNDVIAQGVYFGLRRAGLRVPEDVALVGFDGIAEGQWLDKPLTTVCLPAETLCGAALDILVRRMKSGPAPAPEQIVVPTHLMVGETT